MIRKHNIKMDLRYNKMCVNCNSSVTGQGSAFVNKGTNPGDLYDKKLFD